MTEREHYRRRDDAVADTRREAERLARNDERIELPMVVCRCGRLFQSHRTDLIRAKTDDGTCSEFTPAQVVWPMRRFVTVPIKGDESVG